MPLRKFLPILAILVAAALSAEPLNWMVNGDFTTKTGWNPAPIVQEGEEGLKAAYLDVDQPDWKGYQQNVPLPQPPPPMIEVSARMRTEGVKVLGLHDWETARITVTFYDAKGERAGDWPADVARLTGTNAWDDYATSYTVPSNAATAQVGLLLDHCTGRAWFEDIRLTAYDYDQRTLSRGEAAHPSRHAPLHLTGPNWLLDPGFEKPGLSDWQQVQVVPGGHGSPHALRKVNAAPSWNLSGQLVSFRGKKPAYVLYGGWVKTKGVLSGEKDWEKARMSVDFRDASNHQVGGWQAEVCQLAGDNDWKHYEKRYDVPAGAEEVYVDAGLGNCTGTAWFDDLSLQLLDKSGRPIPAEILTEQATDTRDWYAYEAPVKGSDSTLDLSFLNDKPAGTHGFVGVKDGHFAFADGARVRFWGTDGVGPNLFLDHAEADLVAERMAKLGVNLVRLHFLDNNWGNISLFDPKADDTQHFNPDALDKMDYLIAALKKNGIYVYPDWSVGRKFRKGDGVPGYADLEEGAKTVIHFSRRVIELNKQYARMLLTQVNPYTGLALKDDPVYVGNEIVNESSIFSGFGEQNFPQPFWDELQAQFKAWGGKGAVTRFKFDWDSQHLVPVNHPENADATMRFLLATVTKSNLEMKAFQRSVSPHAMLAGSNMGLPVLGNLRADSRLDFMDTHAYWDHPQIWNIPGGWQNVDHAPMNDNSQLKNPFQGSLLFSLSHARVEGLPLIVTEWNDCFPNEYRLEGPALLAAYGSLQDWDGLLQFDYGPTLIGAQKMTNFGINSRPDNEPLYMAGAIIFREALLKPSDVLVAEPLSDADVLANGSRSAWLFDHPWLPYAVRVAKTFTGKAKTTAPALGDAAHFYDPDKKTVLSSTGEETLDYGRGLLTLDGDFVQGFVGAVGTGEDLSSKGLTVNADKRNPWAAIMAVTLDRKPLKDASRLLVVAVARAENKGLVYNAARNALVDAGSTPILMQGVKAGVALKVGGAKYKVTPLGSSGQRGKPLDAPVKGGTLHFEVSPKDRTAYYLVEKASE